MDQIRIVVVDDNPTRREQIKTMLPEYMQVSASGYGDNAMNLIKPDSEGTIPNLIILNGDDSKGLGLYTFDWMINKSGNDDISNIPVIVLCNDEFSDRSLDFLELGDVTFYEGEVEENELFAVVTQALEKDDFAPEPIEPVYEESKSIDRLMGQSVKVTYSVPGKKRKVVLDMDTQMKNLEAALLRGQKRTEEIRAVLRAAQNGDLDDSEYISRRHKKKSQSEKTGSYGNNSGSRSTGFFKKAKALRGIEEPSTNRIIQKDAETIEYTGKIDDGIPDEFKARSQAERVANLAQKAVSNPSAAMGAHAKSNQGQPAWGANGMQNAGGAQNMYQGAYQQGAYQQGAYQQQARTAQNPQGQQNRSSNESGNVRKVRRRLVIVDDSLQVTKNCEMFLSMNYEVVCLNSGMAAIDFFIKNSADMLIIDAVMPGMGGKQTVESIRFQHGGAMVPVIYLVGNDFQGPREMLMGNNVVGIVSKPISWGALAMSVDGYFRGRR